jgi:hypothetical protein
MKEIVDSDCFGRGKLGYSRFCLGWSLTSAYFLYNLGQNSHIALEKINIFSKAYMDNTFVK